MKPIIFLFSILLLLSSCAATKSITFGNITVLNSNGEIIWQWDDSILGEEFKNYPYKTCKVDSGLIFTDNAGETHYIAGGMIIIDNIETIKPEIR